MTAPVILFIYNRPDTTRRVIEALRVAQPTQLFVVADGARSPDGIARCEATRAVIDEIDWPCEIVKVYSDSAVNLGLRRRVVGGLTQVFDQVDSAIILEDDCVPEPTFFRFCDELLERFRYEDRIMMITGTNPMLSWQSEAQSCHFSHHGMTWGWATWRRAWQRYDEQAQQWQDPNMRQRIRALLDDEEAYAFCAERFQCVNDALDDLDIWDYQWSFSCLLHGGLSVVPAVNLVSNIGFQRSASHTTEPLTLGANLARSPLPFPLHHPELIQADQTYDRQYIRWRRGKPDPLLVARHIQSALDARRPVYALLLIDALLQTQPEAAQYSAISTLRSQALCSLPVRRQ